MLSLPRIPNPLPNSTPLLLHNPLLPAGWLLPKRPIGRPWDSLVLPLQPPAPLLAKVSAEVAPLARLAFHPGRPLQRRLTACFEFTNERHDRVKPERPHRVGPRQPCREPRYTSPKQKKRKEPKTLGPNDAYRNRLATRPRIYFPLTFGTTADGAAPATPAEVRQVRVPRLRCPGSPSLEELERTQEIPRISTLFHHTF